MRYRIVITTYESGKMGFRPQVKNGILWENIKVGRYETNPETGSRENALDYIDVHYKDHKNRKIKSIEFEYINKP